MTKVLVVNPPVYDFSLYDFWLKPYGPLRIYAFLKRYNNLNVRFFDFLDRYSPYVNAYGYKYKDAYGKGKFLGVQIEKPSVLEFVKRKYKRFGIPPVYFEDELRSFKPDFVLVYTGMTYWYPGVIEVMNSARSILGKKVHIVTGGILSTLCPNFLKEKGIDVVIEGEAFDKLASIFDLPSKKEEDHILPCWSAYKELPYVVIRLTEGCPFRCPYCASYILKPRFRVLDIDRTFEHVKRMASRGIRDFVFYDDALLVRKEDALFPFLEKVIKERLSLRFHTPNALHARFIDEETAYIMKKAGFSTIYLGFEFQDERLQKKMGGKVYTYEFDRAVNNLLQAGFKRESITGYVFMGILGQSPDEVEKALRHVNFTGIRVMLSEFSPIPRTPLGNKAIKEYGIDDLLLTNCSVFPLISMGEEAVKYLKNLKNRLNASIPK